MLRFNKTYIIWPTIALLLTIAGCNKTIEGPRVALIETSLGQIKVKLYDETPEHRDNFVKLIEDGFYDDLLFHRVIPNFMIQGGDPKSKDAPKTTPLGDGGPGYLLDAEIDYPTLYHKRGALAAARMPDHINPAKRSSGSQFYIVQGKKWTTDELRQLAVRRNDKKRKKIFDRVVIEFRDSIDSYASDSIKIQGIQEQIMTRVDSVMQSKGVFFFMPDQIQTYTTIGGTPQLDGDYSVFGEVIEGMDVVDKISALPRDKRNRPTKDLVITIKMIN